MSGPAGTYESVFGEVPNRGNNITVPSGGYSSSSSSPTAIDSNNKSAVMGLIGSLISAFANVGLTIYQNRHNEQLARQQNDWNREQWQRETDYNSPVNQVARLRQAGLNPGLVYGNGIENLAASSPDMVSSQGRSPNFGNPFSGFAENLINERLVESTINLQESQAKKNLADAGLSESQVRVNDGLIDLNVAKTELTQRERVHYDYLDSWYEHQSSLTLSMIDEISSKISLNQRLEFESEQRGIGQYIDNLYKEDYWQRYLNELDQLAAQAGANASHVRQQVAELVESWYLRFGNIKAEHDINQVKSDVAWEYDKPIAAAKLRNAEMEIAIRTFCALAPAVMSRSINTPIYSFKGDDKAFKRLLKLGEIANDKSVSNSEFMKRFQELIDVY